jgi:hypothetical protein
VPVHVIPFFLMIIDDMVLHGFIQAHHRRELIFIKKLVYYDRLLNRRDTKPMMPNAKIASVVGSGTAVAIFIAPDIK